MTTLAAPVPAPTPGTSAPRTAELAAAAPPPVFRTVLLYEDIPSARWAARAALQLAAGLSPGARVSQSPWRFDLLDQPRFQFKVMTEAARADAVIVSSHSTELPASVSAWLDAVLADGLILVLLSGSDEGWTITIRHAPGFSATSRNLPAGAENTFRCGTQPALLRQTA